MNIAFYLHRDGEASARDSIRMQFENYLASVVNPKSHGSQREFRELFASSLRDMAVFLGDGVAKEFILKACTLAKKRATDKMAIRHALNFEAIVASHAAAVDIIEALRTHPSDKDMVEQSDQATDLRRILVSSANLTRAIAVLEAAGIAIG